jgi:hypothetical protein
MGARRLSIAVVVTGSPLIAGWIAETTFWCLLVVGILSDELEMKHAGMFVGLWLAGVFGLPHLGATVGLLVTPYVALLDIILILAVFKADVRLH